MHFSPAKAWIMDEAALSISIGQTVNHVMELDVHSGTIRAVPTRTYLSETLFVNSTPIKLIEFLWRWAALQPVLDELSHDIRSFDVTDDFLMFVEENDPSPEGQNSLWVSWADTE